MRTGETEKKWDLYETAVNEMLKKTNTTYAPWHVLESNDKKYARIKALKIVIDAIEAALDNKTNKSKTDVYKQRYVKKRSRNKSGFF